jgi:hypothetical protein
LRSAWRLVLGLVETPAPQYVGGVSKEFERPALRLDDDERKFLHATWSGSGTRVIVTVGRSCDEAGQVELAPRQAKRLAAFLQAGPDAV